MKVKIKSKRTILRGIKQGKYNCIVDYMINNHCGKIGTVVDERPLSYGVMLDSQNGQFKWYWPKWCCKIIKEIQKNERSN